MSFIFLKAFLAFFVLTVSYIVITAINCHENDLKVDDLYLSLKHKICVRVLSLGLLVSLPACLFCWVVGL